jgi:hypothetical protein
MNAGSYDGADVAEWSATPSNPVPKTISAMGVDRFTSYHQKALKRSHPHHYLLATGYS